MEHKTNKKRRAACEAGWHKSRYNLMACVPNTENVAIANLLKGTCAQYTPVEMYLFDALDELDENHPIIKRFSRRGIIANFDELAVLESMGRVACARPHAIGLTICPTMGCNFDCPYCYEDHGQGKMSAEVQDDVVALASRMLDGAGTKNLGVVWFGGEPLLAPDVIESLTKRLMALCDQRGGKYSAQIITNGYLLTREAVDMLDRCKVRHAQVTIDGIGATHDTTRHLAGGGPTFERIVANVRDNAIPFPVSIRHNVHEGNMAQMDALEAFVEELADKSGNDLNYYPAPVSHSYVADRRGSQVGLLCSSNASEVSLRQEVESFRSARGGYCSVHNIWSTCIDDKGNLQKCWEAVDKPQLSYGTAHDWDPADPFATASNVENLTRFLNTANPIPDEDCRECAWLPLCVGGCPYKRLFEERQCVAFKDNPEAYVLALIDQIKHEERPEAES